MPERASFNDLLVFAATNTKAICRELRKRIAALDPEFVEVVWPKMKIASYGVGPRKMTQHYAFIAVQDGYVNLGFYRGAWLPDPSELLEGTGKALRHVKIRDLASARHPVVASLLRAAIADLRRQATQPRLSGARRAGP